jgi:hypothetical protein
MREIKFRAWDEILKRFAALELTKGGVWMPEKVFNGRNQDDKKN